MRRMQRRSTVSGQPSRYRVSEPRSYRHRQGTGSRPPFDDLEEGLSYHGISDGRWSVTAALRILLDQVGPSHLTLAAWTVGREAAQGLAALLADERCLGLRLLVDRSFEARHPSYAATIRELFGDETIRTWNSHAKFYVLSGGEFDILYRSSANLAQNIRLEDWSLHCGGGLPGRYLELARAIFELQQPGQGWGEGQRLARRQTEQVLRGLGLASRRRRRARRRSAHA